MKTPPLSSQEKLRRVFLPLAVCVFLITWLKGFRFPNLWAATHFAFNYSQGFVRRGLVGELARQVAGDDVYRYNSFVAFAFVVFLVVALCVGMALRRALAADPHDIGFKVAVLTFGASPGLVFFVHAIGYNDYLGILLVLLVVLGLSQTRRRYAIFYCVIGASVVSAMVHEGLAIMFGPVLVFAMACHVLRLGAEVQLRRATWLSLILHGMVTSLVLLSLSSIVSTIGVEELKRVSALQRYVAEHADYPTRSHAFIALQRSSKENLLRLMPWYWSEKGHHPPAFQSWQAFAPGYLWLLCYGWLAIKRAPVLAHGRWVLQLLFLVASIAPLSFNFVGWDWGRWNGLALMASFSTLLALKLYFPTRAGDETPAWLIASGMIATAVGLASTTPLFDGFQVQFFPFTSHQQMLEKLFEEGFQYRPRS